MNSDPSLSINRRSFLGGLAVGLPAATLLPSLIPNAVAGTTDDDLSGRIIETVDILKITGPYESTSGVDRQWNATPLHLYDDRRPPAYHDDAFARKTKSNLTHYYVRIRTKNGLEGLYGYFEEESVPPIVNQLGKILLGQDALAAEKLWDQMYRSNRHSRAGHFMMALSQLDNALWDWRGKYYRAPVYQLLGGPTRNPVKAYGSCLGFSVEPDAIAKRCAQLKTQGFDYQKWFFAVGPGDRAKGLNSAIEMVRIARETMGRDGEVMFDAFQAWDLQFARRWAAAVEQYRPYWIEEPFPAADLDSFIQFGRFTNITVATGEHLYNRWETHQYLKNGAAQIIQADPEWCGGVSELVKICSAASTAGAMVIPHCHNVHAALHVIASQSPAVCPMAEFLINAVPGKTWFQKNPPFTDNGWIKLPIPAAT